MAMQGKIQHICSLEETVRAAPPVHIWNLDIYVVSMGIYVHT